MTFTEWYEDVYKEKWNEEYVLLYSFAEQVIDEYGMYCNYHNIKPCVEWVINNLAVRLQF